MAYNHAEEEKHEKGQLMRMVEMELKGMDKEKEEAIRFVKKEKKVFQLHNVLNQVIISNCKHELTQLNQRLDEQEKIKERIMAEEREKLKKQGERIKDIKKNKADIEEMQRGLEKANDSLSKLSVADKNITHEVKFKS